MVYERNYELGAVFEKNIRFIDFDSQTKTLTWESLATDKDKELLRERFKIVKSIVDGVFGKGENIKIALKNQNKSALEVVKEFKFPSLKPKPTTETTAEMKEKEVQKKEIKEKEVQKKKLKKTTLKRLKRPNPKKPLQPCKNLWLTILTLLKRLRASLKSKAWNCYESAFRRVGQSGGCNFKR